VNPSGRKSIVWLASYPKSGNTWLRIFLANYLANKPGPLPINEAHRFAIGDSDVKYYTKVAGAKVNTADMGQTVQLRGRVLTAIAQNGSDVNLVKTHNRRAEGWGVPLIPPHLTRSAIYVMRNPLDMVLSYARHYGLSQDQAAEAICRADNGINPSETLTAQFLGSWQDHVDSWTGFAPYPTLVLRYEDMLIKPEAAFTKVLEHFGISPEPERLSRAIRHSSFKELKKQEKKSGFVERPPNSDAFFSKGQSGQWKDELAPELVKKIRQTNKRAMKKHGYWNE
jgi:hypothetical protein